MLTSLLLFGARKEADTMTPDTITSDTKMPDMRTPAEKAFEKTHIDDEEIDAEEAVLSTAPETAGGAGMGGAEGLPLLPHHAKTLLVDSRINPEIIRERGYRSVTTKSGLKSLGFGAAQLLAPTLLIPAWNVYGEIAFYHHRPDEPRMREGKLAKYEFAPGVKMVVDAHPRIRSQVRDPAVPLFITEGIKKADSAISHGLCCLGLIGTWNWRGTNEFGGKSALPDWDSIALKDRRDKGRKVYVCYDSDVMVKPQVHQALARLSAFWTEPFR